MISMTDYMTWYTIVDALEHRKHDLRVYLDSDVNPTLKFYARIDYDAVGEVLRFARKNLNSCKVDFKKQAEVVNG